MELLGRNTDDEERCLSLPCEGKGFEPGTGGVERAGTCQPGQWLHHEAQGRVATVLEKGPS